MGIIKEQTQRFQVTLDNLEPIGEFIAMFMKEAQLSEELIHNFAVSADEHLSNLVEHAFHAATSEKISITCRIDAAKAQVIIADASAGFDPRKYSLRQVDPKAIYELPPGGFGNYFICQLMDEVDYIHRPHVKNELILTLYPQKHAAKQCA